MPLTLRWTLLIASLAPLASVGVLSAQAVASGCWAGTVGTGARQRRLAIELQQANVTWTGRYHRLERALESGDLADVRVSGDTVRFHATGAPGDPRFEGRLDRNEIKGTAAGRASEPFTLVRVDPGAARPGKLAGRWFGWLAQDGTPVMRIGLNITPAPCHQLLVTMDSPDQGSENLPVSSVTTAGDSLRFAMLYINGSFIGALNGDSLTGQWTQGASLDLRLGRRDSSVSTRRPQDPVPPFPYSSTDVAYANPVDSTRLAGTLTIPQGSGPFPGVLLLTGSGAQDRNESIMGHKPFLVLADYLSRRGVAVLRVDDRGVGGSTGNTFASTIADNAGDALAGVEFLRTQSAIDPARVGLIGHSEGGWVAPLAATRSPHIAFIVLIAGPAVTGEAIRREQDSLLTLAAGGSMNQVLASQRLSRAIHQALKAEPDDSLAVVRMVAAVSAAYDALPPPLKAAVDSGEVDQDSAALADRFRPLATPWYRYLLTFDPVPSLRALRIPVLALFGEKDLQVPPAQSAPVMRRVLARNPQARVHVFPGLNHLFQHAETGAIAEYGRIDETLAEVALTMIAEFVAGARRR